MLQLTKAPNRAPRSARVERVYPAPFLEGKAGSRVDENFSVRPGAVDE